MINGDLEQQPKQLDNEVTSAAESLARVAPTGAELAAVELAATEASTSQLANTQAACAEITCADRSCSAPVATPSTAVSEVLTNPAGNSVQLAALESLWKKLRSQPRETAAAVVLVVTAIMWLDSGNSSQSTASKSLDPMEGFESYLSDFDTQESGVPIRESANPLVTNSAGSFGGDLMIPQSPQSEFSSTVTANYGDSVFEPGNSSLNSPDAATTTAQYPADAGANGSPVSRPHTGGAGFNGNNSGPQQNRRVRFAGRIKPAN